MTNKEKLAEAISVLFNIPFNPSEDFYEYFAMCQDIKPDYCGVITNGEMVCHCTDCAFKDFWDSEYVENQNGIELLTLYHGMSESMQKAVKDIMLVTQKKGGAKNDEQQGEQK